MSKRGILCRGVGVSNFDVPLLQQTLEVRHVDSLQPPFSLLHREVENYILPFCQQHGIGVVAYSPLASGLLGGRYTQQTTFAESDWRGREPSFSGEGLQRNLDPATVAEIEAALEPAQRAAAR